MDTFNSSNLDRDTVFESWLIEFQGQYWFNRAAMPRGASEAYQTYIHWEVHGEGREEAAARQMKEASTNFKEVTGYDILDFLTYERGKNKK